MLDSHYRQLYQNICINPLLHLRLLKKVHPCVLTQFGCLIGISIYPLLAYNQAWLAFLGLIVSGFIDTLDGSLARYLNLTSPRGAALDITCDRLVEFAIILGLYSIDPISRAFTTICMLGSILLCVTTFLVVGIFTENHTHKGFFYSPGLIERAEAFIFFALMILFPSVFFWLAWTFVCLTFFTAIFRLWQFIKFSQI